MESNEYKNGRLAVIKETKAYCLKEIEKLEQNEVMEGDFKSVTRGGMIKAFKRVFDYLEIKEAKTKEHE